MYSKKGYVYIMFNKRNGTLYVGMTSFLKRRDMSIRQNFILTALPQSMMWIS